jgi:hypothetical protein
VVGLVAIGRYGVKNTGRFLVLFKMILVTNVANLLLSTSGKRTLRILTMKQQTPFNFTVNGVLQRRHLLAYNETSKIKKISVKGIVS